MFTARYTSENVSLGDLERQFFTRIEAYLMPAEIGKVKEAFCLAKQAHGDARRKSGELFFSHPLTVALYLADYKLTLSALIAALLHDVAEDTRVKIAEIEQQFGPEVSLLVDGVTKLKDVNIGISKDELRKLSPQEISAQSLHKLFDFTSRDVLVVLIKIFDRLHNMRTIRFMRPDKQVQKAQETLAVFAPMANRLGMWAIKSELESLSLQVLDPKGHGIFNAHLQKTAAQHAAIMPAIENEIREHLLQNGVQVIDVAYYPRQIYSLYRDVQQNGGNYEGIEATMRLAVLVKDELTCYTALGCLHQLWPPVPNKFDDYIAVPRDNLYQSLHTTIVHESGQPIKIRLRTVAMNIVAEIGVLARWQYQDSLYWLTAVSDRVDAFLANIEENINLEPNDVGFGVHGVVDNLLQDQIRVYTPHGEVRELRKGATPIDFAYAIHTVIGNQCRSAYVNGRQVPLNYPLRDGDQIRIERREMDKPQRVWLDEDLGYIVTTRAKVGIRRWFRRLPKEKLLADGRKLLFDELKLLGFPDFPHPTLATLFEFPHPNDLYRALGLADLLPTTLSTKVATLTWDTWPTIKKGQTVRSAIGEEYVIIHAEGRNVRLCRVCNPQPGERIVGFLRRDESITVHKFECYRLHEGPLGGGALKLEWGNSQPSEVRLVSIQIEVLDRTGLLNDITGLLSRGKINIDHIAMSRQSQNKQLMVVVEIDSPRQLIRILHQIMALNNVANVISVPPNVLPNHIHGGRGMYLPE